jgi:predicted HicB family RNase H-like nuclease
MWMKKGSSPTKRLIEMKKGNSAHTKSVKEIQKNGKYSIKYTTSPKKTYVIEPKQGKIDYTKSN